MGIIAGKIVVGSLVAYEKPSVEVLTTSTRDAAAIKSLSEIHRKDADDNQIVPLADRRFSSYFLVNKESDYLDHNIKNNRR